MIFSDVFSTFACSKKEEKKEEEKNNVLTVQKKSTFRMSVSEMSSDSRESLDHRGPPLFFESWYQSRYQDHDLKILNSRLDIKTQDLIVSIPVSISRLKFQKSRFQSRYQDSTIKSLNSSLDIQT